MNTPSPTPSTPPPLASPYDLPTFGNTLALRVDSTMGAMLLSPNSRDAVLAGRRGLQVVDLDDPFLPPRWIHHVTLWEVADVQWLPHLQRLTWVVLTLNQKAMVWNLARPLGAALEHVLHRHVRAITDINFHPTDPDMLATCSVDTFLFAWDLRTPRRPALLFPDWHAAALQVKWSYTDPTKLVAAHDLTIYVWDTRRGAVPVHRIEAHAAVINGLDMGRTNNHIILCLNDMSVKVWDPDSLAEPLATILTDFPVNRARHLPFGHASFGVLPLRGGNNLVYIVNYDGLTSEPTRMHPLYVFKGHLAPVREFLWRRRCSGDYPQVDDREFQLVTWLHDHDLRLWKTNDDLYEKAGLVRSRLLLRLFDHQKHHVTPLPPHLRHPPRSALSAAFDFGGYFTCRREPIDWTHTSRIVRQYKHGLVVSHSQQHTDRRELDWIAGVRMGSASHSIWHEHQAGNLGEEVSMVGHKFPRVHFERISVSTGIVVVSLYGAWGLGQSLGGTPHESPAVGPTDLDTTRMDDLVFIRAEMRFPKEYPRRPPRFEIEESHQVTAQIRTNLYAALRLLADKYAQQDRFCLEMCLRVLLGEKVDPDHELQTETDVAVLNPFEVGPFGSSHLSLNLLVLDDVPALDSTDDEAGFMPAVHGDTPASDPTASDSTPVPKGCAAVWTHDNRLVCFFVAARHNPPEIKFGSQGFGLTKKSRFRQRKALASGSTSESSDDEASGLSDLSDSFTADWIDIVRRDIPARRALQGLFRHAALGLKHRETMDRGRKLLVPTERSGLTGGTSAGANVIRIINLLELIPDKVELAREYRISGDHPRALAEHNALVAQRLGYSELAECWRVVKALLSTAPHDLDAVAGGKVGPGEVDEAVELVDSAVLTSGRFYWGHSPVGALFLVRRIFTHYERLGNVQMLAMLACVLFEADRHSTAFRAPGNDMPLPSPYIDMPLRFRLVASHRSLPALRTSDLVPSRRPTQTSVLLSGSFRSLLPDRVAHRSTFASTNSEFHLFFMTPMQTIAESVPMYLLRNSSMSLVTTMLPQTPRMRTHVPQATVTMLDNTSDLKEGARVVPLLLLQSQPRLAQYRKTYAARLYAWGMPTKRIEVLKFNHDPTADWQVPEPPKTGLQFLYGVGVVEDPSGRTPRTCTYCGLLVKNRVFVCAVCTHVMHAACANGWWSRELECPSGCGCVCTS